MTPSSWKPHWQRQSGGSASAASSASKEYAEAVAIAGAFHSIGVPQWLGPWLSAVQVWPEPLRSFKESGVGSPSSLPAAAAGSARTFPYARLSNTISKHTYK